MNGFPGYQEHRQTHEKMAAHVLELNKKFKDGEISSTILVANFLEDWLAKHIEETDKGHGPLPDSRGVK